MKGHSERRLDSLGSKKIFLDDVLDGEILAEFFLEKEKFQNLIFLQKYS